jgi:hypothetical protein
MGFLSRIFSSQYRRALAAEAASDYALAARLYAECWDFTKVAEMMLLQVTPILSPQETLGRLREAARFATKFQTEKSAARQAKRAAAAAPVLRRIADAIEREARRGAPTAAVDRELLREAAGLFELCGSHRRAAECYEASGEAAKAAELYGRAGDLAKMEAILDRERDQNRRAFELAQAWEEYELEMAAGRRELALLALIRCCESPAAGGEKAEYLRLRADLESRRLHGGHLALRIGDAPPVIYSGTFPIWLGRDGVSGLSLRDGGVSRQHAQITLDGDRFVLTDCASKNGTRLDGILLGAPIAFSGKGQITLGDDCVIDAEISERPRRIGLAVTRGRERGTRLFAQAGPFELVAGVELRFEGGRPLVRSASQSLGLNGARAATELEPIRGDRVSAGDTTWEVL